MKWQRKRSGDVAEHQRQRFRTKKHRMVSCHIVAGLDQLLESGGRDESLVAVTRQRQTCKLPVEILLRIFKSSRWQ